VIAMLPGSRQSEVSQHANLFVETAMEIVEKHPNKPAHELVFLVPLITRETRKIFEQVLHNVQAKHPDTKINIQMMFGHAHDAMEAADLVVVASGTATLEAALLKKPMVITYRMPAISWQILKRMKYLPYVGLPNVLANEFVVPELLQKEANPIKIADTVINLLEDKNQLTRIKEVFTKIHHTLKQDSAQKAAKVVLEFL